MASQDKAGKRRWHEITLAIPGLWSEVLPAFLEERGFSGAWLDEETSPPHRLILRSYLPEGTWQPTLQEELEDHLEELSSIFPAGPEKAEVKARLIDEEDWATKWVSLFQPFRIGSVWIRPSPKDVQLAPGEQEIVLDPGEAFGTGLHESTQLCMESVLFLRPFMEDEAPVLDLGTGSGILAMFAAKVGLANMLALDIDPVAVETAKRNITMNRLERFIQVSNEPLSSVKKRFALILANLSAAIHEGIAEEIRLHLATDGWLVAGGLLAGEGDALSGAWHAKGLELTHHRTKNDWECLVFRARQG
ncbi:MAG: 50S ribosomal protein L11 methyltransferase [Deltaproteobacteria bacterium]|nr:50S ribosomal protein L11 methyltransferase [Deltaproteobacteria bacterium]MBW2171179.1 50S ribosomal protein L11 methyltransferase [Deltaproteobacteria bacterium]MBW2259744.1 50S ribosomal protein L11 methyltransferase [Deltaproteobacteria bacterium]